MKVKKSKKGMSMKELGEFLLKELQVKKIKQPKTTEET